jgi:diadenosine tetraphosphate (Ap4A) HIT family hydrolase
MTCPFCDHATISKQKIFETESEYVFYTIRKSTRGRCLVVPKRHVVSVKGLSEEEAASLFKTVRYVSQKLSAYLKPAGINYGFNEGEIAGQSVEHFHFHIMPRFTGDNLPEFHLFHSDPKIKRDMADEELLERVKEFRLIF